MSAPSYSGVRQAGASSYSSSSTTIGNKPVSMQYTLGQNAPGLSGADNRVRRSDIQEAGTTTDVTKAASFTGFTHGNNNNDNDDDN
ncbi:hypothetical protein QVD17_14832 [Tagetes erecta]|uniref:Uncharacterized protein n=1 Tax=Tagetes erecta TaxID=13708 RepID=A0AAD8KNN8_TARER|nr:hypothetical protein QVD17_14832 [Tagetes erecta]